MHFKMTQSLTMQCPKCPESNPKIFGMQGTGKTCSILKRKDGPLMATPAPTSDTDVGITR